MLKVVIAEDDPFMAEFIEDTLVEGGYEVCGLARTVDAAVELCDRLKPDLAVFDVQLADGTRGTNIAARLDPRKAHSAGRPVPHSAVPKYCRREI